VRRLRREGRHGGLRRSGDWEGLGQEVERRRKGGESERGRTESGRRKDAFNFGKKFGGCPLHGWRLALAVWPPGRVGFGAVSRASAWRGLFRGGWSRGRLGLA
jgi:hypothetical protein